MLAAEEENEAEVRRVDQDNINQFARLNARLHDVQNERERLKVRYRCLLHVYVCILLTLLLWITAYVVRLIDLLID